MVTAGSERSVGDTANPVYNRDQLKNGIVSFKDATGGNLVNIWVTTLLTDGILLYAIRFFCDT